MLSMREVRCQPLIMHSAVSSWQYASWRVSWQVAVAMAADNCDKDDGSNSAMGTVVVGIAAAISVGNWT
jgi:hypothetical protein